MDCRLRTLIESYQVCVAEAVAMLEVSEICERPMSRQHWVTNAIPNRGALDGNGSYLKRGPSCEVDHNGIIVDFDFGIDGQIDGFDLSRLTQFIDKNGKRNPFGSIAELEAAFADALAERSITGSQATLYYLIA